MKKVLFLTNGVNLANSSDGLAKKIHSQVRAFENLGYEVELAGIYEKFYNISKYKYLIKEGGVFKSTNEMLQEIGEYLNHQNDYEILYIRKFYFTPNFMKFIKKIRSKFRYIVLELPTYPYYGELQSLKAKIGYWIEYIFVINNLRKYIDKIITFSNDQKIYDIDCIKISNGIDSSEQMHFEGTREDTINFISVSSVSFWHGIDRFILALNNYSGADVHFHIVGDNNEIIQSLRQMVKDGDIESKVTFHGHKYGDDLKKIYQIAHIGVGSLGRHRSGIYYLNSLKNREYIAKGLPIIYSEIDDILEDKPFVYKISADEKPIDLKAVVSWYKLNFFQRADIVKFSDTFLWEKQINKILLSIGEKNRSFN